MLACIKQARHRWGHKGGIGSPSHAQLCGDASKNTKAGLITIPAKRIVKDSRVLNQMTTTAATFPLLAHMVMFESLTPPVKPLSPLASPQRCRCRYCHCRHHHHCPCRRQHQLLRCRHSVPAAAGTHQAASQGLPAHMTHATETQGDTCGCSTDTQQAGESFVGEVTGDTPHLRTSSHARGAQAQLTITGTNTHKAGQSCVGEVTTSVNTPHMQAATKRALTAIKATHKHNTGTHLVCQVPPQI